MVLVGGQGILSRHLGLTIDYVSAIELVDHSGKVIYANKTNEYSELLWLARGGGSGVLHFPGIITAVELDDLPRQEVEETKEVYTTFQIYYTDPTPAKAEQLLLAWQTFYKDNANDELIDRLTIEPWLWWDEKPKMYLSCYFYGNDALHQHMLERFLPKLVKLLEGEISSIDRLSALAFQRKLAGVKNNDELASGKHGWDLRERPELGEQNRWKGYSAVASKPVTGDAFRTLANSIFYSKPLSRRYVEFKPLGGAIRKQSQNSTAFWHRNALWWSLSSHWHWSSDSAELVNAIQLSSSEGHAGFVEQMGDSFTGSYAGYIDHGNSTGRDLERYYGGNAARIAAIKKKRDPNNLFRFYSSKAAAATGTLEIRKWRTIDATGSDSNGEINRHEGCFVDVDGLGYLIGGRGLKLVNVYDPASKKWLASKNGPVSSSSFLKFSFLFFLVRCLSDFSRVQLVYVYVGGRD